ncbi:MAG: hypothetical protein II007_14960 [Gammaproteobacteria bacterium]|nr:hypothetical protein [Gammaproteobacteria bacterium]
MDVAAILQEIEAIHAQVALALADETSEWSGLPALAERRHQLVVDLCAQLDNGEVPSQTVELNRLLELVDGDSSQIGLLRRLLDDTRNKLLELNQRRRAHSGYSGLK